MRLLTRRGEQERCGCCGHRFRRRQLVELGATPGVFICRRCARWAARRAKRR